MEPTRLMQMSSVLSFITAMIFMATGWLSLGASFVAIGGAFLAISASKSKREKDDVE